MSIDKSKVELDRVRGSNPNIVLRFVLLGFAIVSIVVGMRHALRAIYRFHRWDW